MFQHIYVEQQILNHSYVQSILKRFSNATMICCEKYTQIFNRKNQNFRLQKKKPALILAKKMQNFVLKTPEGYGIGGKYNYYFSHMLNCIYDCRYCFLQGMYSSANYVIFVNFEDFEQAINEKIADEPTYFFSGYDCDSLALESITGFMEKMLPFFEKKPNAFLELRTKSTNISFLRKTKALPNCIVAFTLSPESIAMEYEHKTPSLEARLKALKTLQDLDWPIGIRFDPLLYCDFFKKTYSAFFEKVFTYLNPQKIHSVTLGVFRLPKLFHKKMVKLYPEEKLFALSPYPNSLAQEMKSFCQEKLVKYISKEIFYDMQD